MRKLPILVALFIPSIAAAQAVESEPPIAHDHPAGQAGPTHERANLKTATVERVSSVKAVLASNKDDEDVVLRGRILRHAKGDDYIFSDGTGEIEIELDDDDHPRDRIVMNSEVEIRGEVDLDRGEHVSVEVDELAKLD